MRTKSITNTNAKGKPSAVGKIGNIRVGDKFEITSRPGIIYEIISINPDLNLPFLANTLGLGWPSEAALSYNSLIKHCKKVP